MATNPQFWAQFVTNVTTIGALPSFYVTKTGTVVYQLELNKGASLLLDSALRYSGWRLLYRGGFDAEEYAAIIEALRHPRTCANADNNMLRLALLGTFLGGANAALADAHQAPEHKDLGPLKQALRPLSPAEVDQSPGLCSDFRLMFAEQLGDYEVFLETAETNAPDQAGEPDPESSYRLPTFDEYRGWVLNEFQQSVHFRRLTRRPIGQQIDEGFTDAQLRGLDTEWPMDEQSLESGNAYLGGESPWRSTSYQVFMQPLLVQELVLALLRGLEKIYAGDASPGVPAEPPPVRHDWLWRAEARQLCLESINEKGLLGAKPLCKDVLR